MSIAALLKNFGINVPRYVTVNGEIVLGNVAVTTSGGYVHATHGPVTPVQPHTFHGGAQRFDESLVTESEWWTIEKEVEHHVKAMTAAFPGFAYVPAGEGYPPTWVGEINTGRGAFKVAVILRENRGLPRVHLLGGRRPGIMEGRYWRRSPHLFDGGALCVAEEEDWDPANHTAATATGWAAHWLAAYTEWRITKHWPVEGVQLASA